MMMQHILIHAINPYHIQIPPSQKVTSWYDASVVKKRFGELCGGDYDVADRFRSCEEVL
jgi:hypothetical protein